MMPDGASMLDPALDELLALGGVTIPPGGSVTVTGSDPVLPTRFLLGKAAATALAAQGVAVSAIWHRRTGRPQAITVDAAAAAVSLKSVVYLRQQGYPVPYPDLGYPQTDFSQGYPLTDFSRCRDGRWIFLHAGYPHLRNGLLKLLGCANEKGAVAEAASAWDSAALEDAVAEARLCGGIARGTQEWLQHPQGRLLARLPVVEIERIGDSAPMPLEAAARPLTGVRILDLTHVLAGPTCGRTLAEQGATVLRIGAPANSAILPFVMDTGHGKLSTLLDLNHEWGAERLCSLLADADVFAQSYRPGAFAGRGFSAEAIARLRPGIIYVSFSCYGESGPWGRRGGWEQLAQSVTGMAVEDGSVTAPVQSPVFPNDYIAGYLAAYGVLAALLRRASEGGSYHVKVSLCRTAMWIQSFGRLSSRSVDAVPDLPLDLLNRLAITRQTPYGTLRFLGPITVFSETRSYWELPSAPPAAHAPVWPEIMRGADDWPALQRR